MTAQGDAGIIYRFFELSGGGTCDEAEIAYSIPHQSASARITELRKAGRIRKTGRRRETRTGSLANIYEVVR